MKRLVGLVCTILLVTLSACTVQEIKKNPETSQIHDNPILLTENKDFNVKLTGIEQKSIGMIRPIIIEASGKAKSFDWENVSNPNYYPELTVTDLNQDQRKEWVIFLTTGYGTGVRESKAHVLQDDFSEILIPEPKDDAQKEIFDSVTKNNGSRVYTVRVKGETNTFTFKEGEAGDWFDHVVIGNSISYRIDGHQVISSVSAQVSPAMVIGTVEVAYGLTNNTFKLEKVNFSPYK